MIPYDTMPFVIPLAATPTPAPVEIKISPENRAVLKTLKDLHAKKARAEHHRVLLAAALTDGKTIGGLRRDIKPQLPEIPVELAIEWEEAHITFSDTLTKLLAKYWSNKKEAIDKEIEQTEHKLAVSTTEAETAHISSLAIATYDSEVIKLAAPKPQRPPRQWQTAKRRRGGAASNPGNNSGQ